MLRLSARALLALGLVAVAALGVSVAVAGSAADPTDEAPATASAAAIRILVPGASGGGTQTLAAPPAVTPLATGGYAYPADGSVLTAVSTNASAAADDAIATGSSGVTGLSLFGGEITADTVLGYATATTTETSADGGFGGTTTQNVQVLGSTPAGTQAQLGDWGTLSLSAIDVERTNAAGIATYKGSVSGLTVTLTAAHGGLPAGTVIQVGYAEVAARSQPPGPKPVTEPATPTNPAPGARPGRPEPGPTPPDDRPAPADESEPTPLPEPPPGLFPFPPELSPELEGGPYVFPIFGSVSYGNTYGEIRSTVSYHHGADIFGELGQPLVAVADGIAFSVGRNRIGGNRLWIRDRQGNAFYYAHLSAFSTLIFNGARVKAGQVVGFMGNTGDAQGTIPHLHFEVHPVSLLYLGYDGAIDPTLFLDEARRLQRLPFPIPPGWAPSVDGSNAAPQPGAILLAVSDISRADGLDPDSLRRAFAASQARP
jgi:murein DD-endopeptidase MepM/ murein hydrolase activator NlpD